MNRTLEQVKRLPAKSALDVIKSLWHEYEKRSHQPYLTLGIGKMQVTGWLCGVDLRAQDVPMVIVPPTSNGQPSDDIVYVSGRMVEWLTVHNASDYLVVLSDGRIDPLEVKDPPGKLQLNRKQKELANQLHTLTGAGISVEIDWQTVKESERRAMVVMDATIDALAVAVHDLVTDKFACDAVRAKISRIDLRMAAGRELLLANGTLVISVSSEGGTAGYYSGQDMKTKLNSVL